MNEQDPLELSWTIAKDTPNKEEGFKGSLEDYKNYLKDPKNLNKAFDQAKGESYPGEDVEVFAKMLGVDMEVLGEGKSNGVVAEDAAVAPEMQASESMELESEDISSDLKKPKKEEEEDLKYNEDYNRKLKAFELGNIMVGEFLASIPETLYNLGAVLPNMVAEPENYPLALKPLAYQLKQKGYLPDVVTAEKTKKKYNIKNPLLDNYREEREKIQNKNAFYDENANEYIGVFESFKNGKIDEGFSQLGNSILESAPVSIAMMAGGAGTSFTKLAVAGTIAMTDSELQEQRKNNPNQTETENVMKALGMAGAEMVFESVGKGTLGKAYKTIIAKEGKEKGVKLFRDGVIKMYQKALIKSGAAPAVIGGGLEEVGTQITQNLINGKDPYEGVADAFLIGVGSGGVYGSPINVAQSASLIQDGITNVKANKILKNTDYNSISDAFSTDVSNKTQIKLSKLSNGSKILDKQVKRKIDKNEITQEEGDKIRSEFRETQGVVNTLKPLGLDLEVESTPELIDLIKKQGKLQNIIKEVNNPALTKKQKKELIKTEDEISEVQDKIEGLVIESRTSKLAKGATVVGEKVGVDSENILQFDDDIQVDKEIKNLAKRGFIEKKQKKSISANAKNNFGTILRNPKTGEQVVLINKTVAKEFGIMTTTQHEIAHAVVNGIASKDPTAEAALGRSVLEEIKNNKNVSFFNKQGESIDLENTVFYNRYLQYRDAIENGKKKYTEAQAFGEIVPLLSEALTPDINGTKAEITINETSAMKIGDIFRRLLQSVGINVNFKSGKDVLNFVRDYNRSVETGGKGKKAIGQISKKAKVSDKLLNENQKQQLKEDEEVITQSQSSERKTSVSEAYKELQQIDETESNFTLQPTKQKALTDRKKELLKIVKDENVYEELRLIDEFEADFNPTEASKNRKKELLKEIESLDETETKSSLKIEPTEKQKIASAAVQKLFQEKPRDWEGKVIQLYKPITSKLVEMRRFKHDDFNVYKDELLSEIENSDRGILGLIRRYDPERNDSLAAFISGNLPRRMIEVDEKIFPKGFTKQIDEQRTSGSQDSDITIEDSIDESITPTKKEELNLRKKIKLPDDQVEKVRQAVRKTFGTRLPKVKSPEFKKALRKAYDTELFKELKTNVFKTRDEYRNFLRENWKALYDAIPQETLNQSFATFREPVLDENGKQKREKTPEGERIFRKKNINREEFLDYFFNTNIGGSTRGTRKDAIVRMLAQELGFDATMETIQEPKVAEKIAFANPSVKVPDTGAAINRVDERFSEVFKKDLREFVQGIEINFNNEKLVEATKKQVGSLSVKLGLEDTINFIMPMVTRGYYFKEGENKRKILFKGRADFFNYMKENFPESPFATGNWKSGETFVEVNGKNYLLRTITSQSTKGVTSGNFQKTIGKRQESAKEQRAGLLRIVNELKELIKTPEGLKENKNTVAMYLATLTSNIDALVRTAAIPTDIFLIKGLVDSDYVYEHSKTAYDVRSQIGRLVFNENMKSSTDINNSFNEIMDDYTVAIIPRGYDRVINKFFNYRGPREKNKNLSKTKRTSLGPPLKPINGVPSRYALLVNEFKSRGLIPLRLNKITEERVENEVTKRSLKKYKATPKKEQSKTTVQSSEKIKKAAFFNKMIEIKTGIPAKQKLSAIAAAKMGEANRKINFFISPSAEDFMGLMYKTIGKGKVGDAQKKWINENIMRPYAIGIEKITIARNVVTNSFQAIAKDLNITEKDLKKKIPNSVFTQEDAVRVYIWAKQGLEIPGILKKEQKELVSYINGKSNLVKLANNVIKINNVDFKTPTDSWQVGNLGTDLLESLNTTRRAEFLEEWQNNVDDIFSENNINKLEAAFGKPYKLALENSLQRMKTGRNRNAGRDNTTNRVVDWTNGATGAIMFFNSRSAILQTISAVNFINFGDNNIIAAGKAFANQKQYWSDVTMLFNSEFLVNRRDGLKMSVNEADIADVARQKGVKGLIAKLLKIGFTPTQVADSIAIATGGATFYRNRYNALVKSGMSNTDAQTQAMRDFRETAEESQQSSRPDKISQQQASELGRIILAFANTPSQYARIIKKSALDLKNRRGSDKENISKILYYTVAQNLLFNALQQAMFAVAFGDIDEEDKLKKEIRVANGMADSLLRGMGIQGAVFSVVKNAAIRVYKEEYKEIPMELLRISPPISSKFRKVKRATDIMSWDGDEIFEKGLTLDNPAVEITSKTIEALTNLPLDRAIKKITNLKDATDSELEFYQRLALTGGWNKWELGIKEEKKKKIKSKTIEVKSREPFKN